MCSEGETVAGYVTQTLFKGFREIMTFSTGSHIGENDCPVILVNGVLFTVAPNPAVQFPMAATNSSYLQHTPLFPILYSDWKHT
jgi:hypothetical protein